MSDNRVHLIYFSPTGTTRTTVNAIAKGLAPEQTCDHNLTFAFDAQKQHLADGIAVIGIPVYAGRVPVDCLERLSAYTATDMPTILVALYGNREFEDALVELRDVVTTQGFKVVAAGAFIGEHSYSTPERPIAADRPDAEDVQAAIEFGRQVAAKLAGGNHDTPAMDGNVPYKERVQFGGVAPETNPATCILCGRCAAVCPVRVIKLADQVDTQADNCIMCTACVRACPTGARVFNHPLIEERRAMLFKNCSTPKAPKLFL